MRSQSRHTILQDDNNNSIQRNLMTNTSRNDLPADALAWIDRGFEIRGAVNHGIVSFVEIAAYFVTDDERDAALAAFPKSAKLYASTLSGGTDIRWCIPSIHTHVLLRANGVNGGVNETGIKRLRTIVRNAEKAGITITTRRWCSNAATIDDMIAATGIDELHYITTTDEA